MNNTRNTNVANVIAALLQPGERYAGVTLDATGHPKHHVILLPHRADDDGSWQVQMEWAASVGGKLPNRQEQALLYANCKDALPRNWCWLDEEFEETSSFAWYCHPATGFQICNSKSLGCSAVAVRLIPATNAVCNQWVDEIEPVAFALRWSNDPRLNLSTVFDTEKEATEYAAYCSGDVTVVPLYTNPALAQKSQGDSQ